ncbi:MAG: DNA polymerase III subunit delta' [Desulfuromonadales bacterium]|nr:DNA polymerase III subunit delta' [Desulfuromonadales bacterium]
MTFDAITGHKQQKNILLRTIKSNRIAHAYLFTGPDGIGKKMVAVAFAKILLCQNHNGCNNCPSCIKITNGNHPDVHLLDTEGAAIKIEKVRALQRELSLHPLEGKYKIYIINGADKFTTNAANALLKTLEEPQAGTILVLLSSQPETLLSTIRSRCQQLPFSTLPKQQMAAILKQKLELSDTDATVLAALSEGSFKKALGSNRELFLEKRLKLIQSLSALSAGSTIPTFTFADELNAEEESITDILDIFQTFYRDILLLKHNQPENMLVNIDLFETLQRQNKSTTTARLLTKLKALESARFYMQRNVNRKLVLEVMLMRISAA